MTDLPSIFVIVRGSDFLKVGDDVVVFGSRDEAERTLSRLNNQMFAPVRPPQSGAGLFPTTSALPYYDARVVEYIAVGGGDGRPGSGGRRQ